MQWLWIVLGLVLLALLGTVLYSFFIARPRSIAQLRGSAELLSKETHGRQPLLMTPAKCEAVSAPEKEVLRGVGVLALTEQGVIFSAANPDRTLIVPRDAVNQSELVTTFQGANSQVTGRSLLAVGWRNADEQQVSAAFTVANPEPFLTALSGQSPTS